MNKCILPICLMLLAQAASAHESRPSLLRLDERQGGAWHAVFKQPQVGGRYLNLKVETNCGAGEIAVVVGVFALQESFDLNCAQGPLDFIRIAGLKRTLVDTMVTINTLSGETRHYLISSGQDVLRLDEPAPSVPTYLMLGIEHLLFGIDHVLFVLLLLYVVSGWIKLLKVITSFTVAHSITLGLAAFDVVTLSSPPVEALIALSIVLLSCESVRQVSGAKHTSIISENTWVLAFMFGLLHGLGFASALAEIGLPKAGAVLALFLFNVGIELGQLMIVIGFTSVLLIAQRLGLRQWRFEQRITLVPLYLIGCVASYWFIDRAVQILTVRPI